MTLPALLAYRQALREQLQRLDAISPTCLHCDHFASGRCAKFDALPPEDFQRTPEACPDWQYDGIPF